jgi:hypothetical protein
MGRPAVRTLAYQVSRSGPRDGFGTVSTDASWAAVDRHRACGRPARARTSTSSKATESVARGQPSSVRTDAPGVDVDTRLDGAGRESSARWRHHSRGGRPGRSHARGRTRPPPAYAIIGTSRPVRRPRSPSLRRRCGRTDWWSCRRGKRRAGVRRHEGTRRTEAAAPSAMTVASTHLRHRRRLLNWRSPRARHLRRYSSPTPAAVTSQMVTGMPCSVNRASPAGGRTDHRSGAWKALCCTSSIPYGSDRTVPTYYQPPSRGKASAH